MSDVKVQETTEYESCLDFESDDINDVSKFMDGQGVQEEELPVVEIDDYNAFAKLIDQALTDKSKSIWYPKLDIEENSLNRWIVE